MRSMVGKGVLALLAIAGIVGATASPSWASWSISPRTYADSGSYCANAGGAWGLLVHGGGQTTVVAASSSNASLQYFGFSCGSSSPATYNTLAVWNHIERWTGSSAAICKSTPWTPNANGDYDAYSGDNWLPLGCGAGSYRSHVQARITYNGTANTSDASGMTSPLVTSWETL